MSRAILGEIAQVGYLVEDIDAAVQSWVDRLGVGPWTVFRNVGMAGTYRGVETMVTMNVALGYQGETQVELIAPINQSRSPYRDEDGRVLLGIHHVAWLVDDIDNVRIKLEAAGLEARFAAHNETTRVIYFADDASPGVLYEVIESPITREHIAAGIAATRAWDGGEAILAEYDFAVMAG